MLRVDIDGWVRVTRRSLFRRSFSLEMNSNFSILFAPDVSEVGILCTAGKMLGWTKHNGTPRQKCVIRNPGTCE